MSGIDRLIGLVRDWWRVDRIRSSPREGRLLRLEPGDLLRLAGVTVTVIDRRVDPDASGVRYRCAGDGFIGELRVTLAAGRQADGIVWSREGRQCCLFAAEVEVYSAIRRGSETFQTPFDTLPAKWKKSTRTCVDFRGTVTDKNVTDKKGELT